MLGRCCGLYSAEGNTYGALPLSTLKYGVYKDTYLPLTGGDIHININEKK